MEVEFRAVTRCAGNFFVLVPCKQVQNISRAKGRKTVVVVVVVVPVVVVAILENIETFQILTQQH